MSTDVFYVKQGDTAPSITTTLIDPQGNPVDLTGATVQLRGTQLGVTLLVNCDVEVPETDGRVTYDWQIGDLDEWGGYALEWIVAQGGTVQTFPSDGYNWLEVLPNLTTDVGGACTVMEVRRLTGSELTGEQQAAAIWLIQSLTAALERRLNRLLSVTSITGEVHRIGNDHRLIPYRGPVLSMTSITVDGSPWVDVLDDWDITEFPVGARAIIDYQAGGAPDQAVKDLVAQVVARTLLSPAGVASGSLKGYSVEGTSITYGDVANSGPGSAGRLSVGDLGSLKRLRRHVLR